jgi:hypothetical protein
VNQRRKAKPILLLLEQAEKGRFCGGSENSN